MEETLNLNLVKNSTYAVDILALDYVPVHNGIICLYVVR
jgi:hypothetical protein